jgi:hypothetical protein
MAQKAQIIEEELAEESHEENKENIIGKYKELGLKCDSIIEKIAKKKKVKTEKK